MVPASSVKKSPPEAEVVRRHLEAREPSSHDSEIRRRADVKRPRQSSEAQQQARRLGAGDRESSKDGKQSMASHAQKATIRRRSTFRSYLLPLVRVCLACIVLGWLLWWREEKLKAGFCDVGSTSNERTRQRDRIDSQQHAAHRVWASLASHLVPRPSCTACPAHGVCTAGEFAGCAPSYVPQQHPLRLGGALPLPPMCVPDTEKLMIVAREASDIARILKARRGDVICRGTAVKRSKLNKGEAWTYGYPATSLWHALRAKNAVSRKCLQSG